MPILPLKTPMRSVGENMLIGIKNAAKLIGISIISCCATLVCTMFMNYTLDLKNIEDMISPGPAEIFYDAQMSTSKVVIAVTGGCLLMTSAVMLSFYVKHYIDTHKKELGILKALGYPNIRIAKRFGIFGTSVFIGTLIGFGGAFALMPEFYGLQNEDKILPEIAISFHPSLLLFFVVLPTALFALLAVFYAVCKLRMPAISLIKDTVAVQKRRKRQKSDNGKDGEPFLGDLRRSTLKNEKVLVFFVVFASFCFSAMTQMSFSMKDLSSFMMGVMIMLIGIILAFTTLFLSLTSVIKASSKTIAMMKVFGYSRKECRRAILDGYRPAAYIGFAVGSIYQYLLLKIMVEIVFSDVENIPEYKFDIPIMLISLAAFAAVYEAVVYAYSIKICKISVKEIMSE